MKPDHHLNQTYNVICLDREIKHARLDAHAITTIHLLFLFVGLKFWASKKHFNKDLMVNRCVILSFNSCVMVAILITV